MQKKSAPGAASKLIMALFGLFMILSAAAEPADQDQRKDNPTLPDKWVDTFRWRCIGPANMGGRIVALAVCESDHSTWWAATASGGLLKTTNNGVTFTHQFDREKTVSIGHVAVAPSNPEIVWIGTGEPNPRNSVSWGDGVYKSTDGGETWTRMGLEKTFQIGRIAIHPENPDIVYVGALGRLWGPNEERGLFKTVDGGKTWDKILYIDDKTGVIDVQLEPGAPDTILAATYERERDRFDSNDPSKKWGPGSGIYKSTDGGKTFEKKTAGLPSCSLGRIDLEYFKADPRIVFAVVESERVGQEPENAPYIGIRGEDVEVGARLTEILEDGPAEKAGIEKGDVVLSIEDETVHSYEDLVAKVRKYLADDTVKIEVSRDHKSVVMEVTFSKRPGAEEDSADKAAAEKKKEASSQPRSRRNTTFSSGLGGQRHNIQDQQGPEGHEFGGVYKSEDGGGTWTRINSVNPRPMYFSQIRVDPTDANHLYVLGISLYRSSDGGVTFTDDGGRGVHLDHHALWIDPRDGRHIILGTDGGLYVTHDRMEKWDQLNQVAIGQFYHVAVDPRPNYNVYGGLQDNGTWGGPTRSRSGDGPVNEDWFSIGGGDGFVCRVDPEDPDLVYYESQNGSMGRHNLRTGDRGYMRPRAPRGTRYRFNWKTPYILSHHNSSIFYCAGNHVFRSLSRGDKLKAISPEITNTDKGSGTALAESHFDPDILYVGTDDGALWRTRNNGHDWVNLFEIAPEEEKTEPKKTEKKPDRAGKGRPGAEEGATGRPEGRGRGKRGGERGRVMERFAQSDANGDGRIEKNEVPERMAVFFDRLDANGDGAVDKEELEAVADRMGGPPPRESKPDTEQRPAEPPAEEATETVPEADGTASQEETGAAETPTPRDAPKEGPAAGEEDTVSGVWEGQATGSDIPKGQGGFTVTLKLGADGKTITGSFHSEMSEGEISEGRYNADKKTFRGTIETDHMPLHVRAVFLSATRMQGSIEVGDGIFTIDFDAKRTTGDRGAAGDSDSVDGGGPKSKDDGYEWKRIDALLPQPLWVSCLETSRFDEGRVYVTFDGHRSNDDLPYVFVSEDHGATWRGLAQSLPPTAGSARVLREDIENPDILYLGTEFSIWVTIDRGRSWTRFNSNLPTVAIHEIAQHPSTGEIVAATHGRSLWILDVTPLRQMNAEITRSKTPFLFEPRKVNYWRSMPRRGGSNNSFKGQNPPSGAEIYYFLGKKARRVGLKITDQSGNPVRELIVENEVGLGRLTWDLRRPRPSESGSRRSRGYRRGGPRVAPGTYSVTLTVDNQTLTQLLVVEGDPEYPDAKVWGETYDER